VNPARRAGLALGLGILLGCSRTTPADRQYATGIVAARAQKDAIFRTDSGPLTSEQRGAFKGLRYFAPDPGWRCEARLELAARADTLGFPTSKQTFDPYVRVGRLQFEHRGQALALTLYRSVEGGQWFLPFRDRTSGGDTYGAGRYLDVEPQPDGRVRLDFNRAYNPYCAYNTGWICPLPPPENTLDVAVRAGEKGFDAGH
jgi:uncharacterized protein (DUF1684 family)